MTVLEAEELCTSVLKRIDGIVSSFDAKTIDSLDVILNELDKSIVSYYELKAHLDKRYAEIQVSSSETLADVSRVIESLNHRIDIMRSVLGLIKPENKELFSSIINFIQEYSDYRDSLIIRKRKVCSSETM